jgi:Leucine-rich repeat (LRR) protein
MESAWIASQKLDFHLTALLICCLAVSQSINSSVPTLTSWALVCNTSSCHAGDVTVANRSAFFQGSECTVRMTKLNTLNISGNQLTAFPLAIHKLTGLSSLSIGNNMMTSLLENIGGFSLLEELNIHAFNLNKLPTSFSKLVNLKRLSLDDNHFNALPKSITSLPLVRTKLGGNKLTTPSNSRQRI